jgi:hypothetical protein
MKGRKKTQALAAVLAAVTGVIALDLLVFGSEDALGAGIVFGFMSAWLLVLLVGDRIMEAMHNRTKENTK